MSYFTFYFSFYQGFFHFFLQFILLISWFRYEPLKKGDYEYPGWANGIGWAIAMTAILAVPFVAIVQILHKVFVEYKDEDTKEVLTSKNK
jgi:hypothetical protein